MADDNEPDDNEPDDGGEDDIPTMDLGEIKRLGGTPYKTQPETSSEDDEDIPTMDLDEIKRLGGTPYREPPEAQGALKTFGKAAARNVVPTAGGLAAAAAGADVGAGIGGAIGSVAGPAGAGFGAGAGGLLGGIYAYSKGSEAVSDLQDWLLSKVGLGEDKVQTAANAEAHPYAQMAGEIAPSLALLQPGKLAEGLKLRAMMAGIGGVQEAGSEADNGQDLSAGKIALAAAAMGALNHPTKLGASVMGVGERAGARIRAKAGSYWAPNGQAADTGQPGRPDLKPDTGDTVSPDTTTTTTTTSPVAAEDTTNSELPTRSGVPQHVLEGEILGPDEIQNESLHPERRIEKGTLIEGTAEPGTSDAENKAIPATKALPAPEKTDEFIQRSKREALPARNNAGTLGTSHAEAPPPKDPSTVGSNPDHPLSVGGERDYKKTPGSNVGPTDEDTPPTMNVGDPAQHNIQPDEAAALAAHSDDNNTTSSEPNAQPAPEPAPKPAPRKPVTAPVTDTPEQATIRKKLVDVARAPGQEKEELAKAIESLPGNVLENYRDKLAAYEAARAKEAEATSRKANRSTVEGVGTIAETESVARQRGKARSAADEAFEAHPGAPDEKPPVHPDNVKALHKRAQDIVNHYNRNTVHPDTNAARAEIERNVPQEWDEARKQKYIERKLKQATNPAMSRDKSAGQMAIKAAEKLAKMKRPTVKAAMEFYTTEKLLRSGGADVVKETNRVEGDRTMNRRGQGDAAVQRAEEQAAKTPEEPVQERQFGESGPITDEEVDKWVKQVEADKPNLEQEGIKPRTEPPKTETLAERMARQKAARLAGQKPVADKPVKKAGGYADEDLEEAKRTLGSAVRDFMTDESGSINWANSKKYSGPQRDVLERALKAVSQHKGMLTAKLWANHVLAKRSEDWGFGKGMKNPLNRLADYIERSTVKRREISKGDEDLIERVAKEDADFHEILHDESALGLYGDRANTPKDQGFTARGGSKAWRDANYSDVAARVGKLTPEQIALRNKTHATLKDREQEITHNTGIRRILAMLGVNDPALADRIMTGTETPADIAGHGQETIDLLRPLGKRSLLKGPYVPLARRGKYAVYGRHRITDPANGTKLGDNKWTFDTAADRDTFSDKQVNEPTDGSVYMDSQGSLTHANGKRYTSEDFNDNPTDLTRKYTSAVNDHHLEFVDTEREAIQRHKELGDTGAFSNLTYQKRRWRDKNPATLLASELGFSSDRALASNEHYQKLTPAEQAAVRETLAQQHLDLLASTKPMNRSLRRQGTSGYATDLARSLMEWSHETSQKMALGEFAPGIDDAIEEARKMAEPFAGDPKTTNMRRVTFDEFAQRLADLRSGKHELNQGPFGNFVNRALVYSALDRLATPRFIVQNLTQVATHTWSYLNSEYGVQASTQAIVKAYKDIGAGGVLKDALTDTAAAAKTAGYKAQSLEGVINRLTDPVEQAAMRELVANGSINEESTNQMERLTPNPEGVKLDIGKGINPYGDIARRGVEAGLTGFDKGMSYIQDVSRPLNNAAEILNRGVTGLATFRLEYAKNGGNFEEAVKAATDAINTTQVRYSDSNKPAWMRSSIARIPLQFKPFGFQQAAIFGRGLRQIINGSPNERKKAAIMIGSLLATTAAFAGFNGLPGEQIVAPIMSALKLMGLTDRDWNDVQYSFRKSVTQVAGQRAAGVASHGLPRLMGLDFTGNLGLNNVLTFGSPDYARVHSRDYYQNVLAWLAQTGMGSAGSLGFDMFKMANALTQGDPLEAAQHFILPRFMNDTLKAGIGFAGGKVSDRGVTRSKPYSAGEAIKKALGFAQPRDVDEVEAKHELYVQSKRRTGEITDAVTKWLNAKTPDAKRTAFLEGIAAGASPGTFTRAAGQNSRNKNNNYLGTAITPSSRAAVNEVRNVYGE